MNMEWDETRMELLKRLWLSGETARAIAEKLGSGVTRNAVIGKAHRLGLTGQQGSVKAAHKRPRAPASKERREQEPRRTNPRGHSR